MLKKTALFVTALFIATGALTGMAGAGSARDYISIVGSSTVYPFATVVAEQFGKTTRSLLLLAQAQQVSRPVNGTVHMTKHDGRRSLQPNLMGGSNDLEPFCGIDLVRAEARAHLIIQNFRGRTRQAAQSRLLQFFQITMQIQPQRRCAGTLTVSPQVMAAVHRPLAKWKTADSTPMM